MIITTDFPSVAIPNGNDVSDSNFKAWALEVAKAIWLLWSSY